LKSDSTPLPSIPYKGKKFDVTAFLQRRKMIILILGGFLFAMLVPFAIVKGSFVFEVTGRLLIAREIPTLTRQTDENIVSYFSDYSRTQVERLGSIGIIEAAIQSLPEDIRWRFKPKDLDYPAAAALLKRNLVTDAVPNTHLLALKLTGSSPEGLAEMLNAIMDTYLRKLQSEEENKDTRRIKFLSEERDKIQEEIRNTEEEVNKLALSTKSISFQDQSNIHLGRYLSLQTGYLDAYKAKLSAEKEYQATEAMAKELKKIPNKVLSDEMVANDQSIWHVANWTYQKLQELRTMMDGIARDNPDRRYVEQRMEAMQDYERKTREEVRERDERLVNEKRDYEVAKKLIEARHAYLAREGNAEELKSKMEEAQANLEKMSLEMLRGQELLKDLENKRTKLFDLQDRIRNLELESKTPLRVSIEAYAVKPESASGSNLKKLYLLTIILSFGLAAVAFVIYDFLDNRIRSPKDILNYLGHPPTWPISCYPSQERGGITSFARVMLDDPDHIVAKAVRSLAVRLNKERLKHGAKIALMTAVDVQSGTTGITINTAQAMKHFCRKVLIVDANTIHPGVAEMAGQKGDLQSDSVAKAFRDFFPLAATEKQSEAGLREEVRARQLLETVDLDIALLADQERGIDFLLLGDVEWTSEFRRQVPVLLSEMSRHYDFILVDSAPILLTDATELLVTLAQVVVLIAQGDRTKLMDFAHTTELVLRLEVPAMAAVLNWGGIRPLTWFDGVMTKVPFPAVRQALQKLNDIGNTG